MNRCKDVEQEQVERADSDVTSGVSKYLSIEVPRFPGGCIAGSLPRYLAHAQPWCLGSPEHTSAVIVDPQAEANFSQLQQSLSDVHPNPKPREKGGCCRGWMEH